MGTRPRFAFLRLCCEEPFRLLFPLGILIGISGVSLWPLFFTGLHKFYPGIMHARMMIEGFLCAFVIGFLGTAGPRLTGTPPLSPVEFGSLVLLLLGAVGTHIGQQYVVGDLIFLVLLLTFAWQMGRRFLQRADLPPPTFALVPLGFGSAFLGTCLSIASTRGAISPALTLLGSMLLNQGFLLLLVLGVGGFLVPKFLSSPRTNAAESESVREITPAWKRQAIQNSAAGGLLLLSFVVEVFAEAPRTAGLLRTIVAGLYLTVQVLPSCAGGPSATVARSLRLALVLLLSGLLFPVLWPLQRVAGLHLVFIGGFTLITFAVATRVILGHSGSGALSTRPLPFLRSAVTLLIIAAALRVIGDFLPMTRSTLLNLASYIWMLSAAVWSWRLLPRVRITDPAP